MQVQVSDKPAFTLYTPYDVRRKRLGQAISIFTGSVEQRILNILADEGETVFFPALSFAEDICQELVFKYQFSKRGYSTPFSIPKIQSLCAIKILVALGWTCELNTGCTEITFYPISAITPEEIDYDKEQAFLLQVAKMVHVINLGLPEGHNIFYLKDFNLSQDITITEFDRLFQEIKHRFEPNWTVTKAHFDEKNIKVIHPATSK